MNNIANKTISQRVIKDTLYQAKHINDHIMIIIQVFKCMHISYHVIVMINISNVTRVRCQINTVGGEKGYNSQGSG